MCIHYLGHPTTIPASGQNLFCPLIFQCCRRKTIIRKNMAFLLVCNSQFLIRHLIQRRYYIWAIIPATQEAEIGRIMV
jgi:hypothetical protein